MRVLLIILVTFAVTNGLGILDDFGDFVSKGFDDISSSVVSNVEDFGDFLAKTGKSFASAAEREIHEGIFAAKKAIVDSANEAYAVGESTYKLALNAFSDLSKAEFLSSLTGLLKSDAGEIKARSHRGSAPRITNQKLPMHFDWRRKGGVTPIKFQGLKCRACWSFAVTGALEGHYFRKTKQLISLSEQHLIDCSGHHGNTGCRGGYQEYGFSYVIENNGIAKSDSYPYKMKNGKCHYRPDQKGADMKAFAVIQPGNERKMMEVIATLGPLACSVNADPDTFHLYDDGIYSDNECNKGEVNHSVLVVGYGSEKGQDYWILKNSWNYTWGELGYMRIPRNKNNFCGIATECSYPIL